MGTRTQELQASMELIWDYADHACRPGSELRADIEFGRPLMQAAPNLLEALQSLLDWGRDHTSPTDKNSPHELLVAAHDAIAAATQGVKAIPHPRDARHATAIAIASAYQLPHDDHAIEIASNPECGDSDDGAVWVTARIRVSPEEIDAIV